MKNSKTKRNTIQTKQRKDEKNNHKKKTTHKNNSRASMAQCRIKKLEKMEVIEQVVVESTI